MSKEFEKKIEELFLHKEKIVDSNLLEKLIRESYKKNPVINEQRKINLEDFYKSLPKIDVTELLGNNKEPGQEARSKFNMMISKVVADVDPTNPASLEQKLTKLTQYVISEPEPEANISDTLNKLFFIKGMQQLLLDYTGRISGTLFESFIAALMGGETIGSSSDIDDVLLPNNRGKINLKFIKINSDTTGSIRLALKKYAANINDIINFYIAYKGEQKDKVSFYHVTYDYKSFISLQNVVEILNGAGITSQELQNLNTNIKIMDSKLLQFKDKVKDIQFKIPYEIVKKKSKPITLNLDQKAINNVLRKYSQILDNNLRTIYYNLALLTSSINSFYLEGDITGADTGAKSANKIENAIIKAASSKKQNV